MDENSKNITDFESLLNSRPTKRLSALYNSSENSKNVKISAKDVLMSVSKQVKALQNADTVSYKRVGKSLEKYKKREFLPVDMVAVDRLINQKQSTKFETQCVTDTQLIDIIESVEIVDKHRGVTQEFNKTFHQNSEDYHDKKLNDSTLKPDSNTDAANNTEPPHEGFNDEESKLLETSNPITCEMDTITCHENYGITDFSDDVNTSQVFNKSVELFDVSELDAERPVSPVLNTNRKCAASPLVVDLYTFEKFENLANPIIEEHEDFTIAKNMINSQIIGREIMIPAHNYDNFGRHSPVIRKIDCITTNVNKDDVDRICTCSNNCINKDVKCTGEPVIEDINLSNVNKKTQSKIIKTEIKDEILFSSDEEYEYLHKSIQELPLTCALETSFYDRSDVLDKTMYVGFQTASNKSIQINTDSFTKAKSILSNIDNLGTGTTLSDLVEIFDSGKAVSENIKLANNKLECVIGNNMSSKIDFNDMNIAQPSKKKRDDIFENVSPTASERLKETTDDIITSQIINFKSTSRCHTFNDSIISEGKVNDTFDNVSLTALEQNKDIDDILISQVITFKSTPKTPRIASNVNHESSQLSKVIAKRKLEGFKTASNKKIKLTDQALARCRKVFQDIDLRDTTHSSQIKPTEEIIRKGIKAHGLNISCDAFEDFTTKERENDTGDNVADLKVEEKQPRMENLELQINDRIILQEFEENEMPLEGTKTACDKNKNASDVRLQNKARVLSITNSNSTMKSCEKCIDDSNELKYVVKKSAGEVRKGTMKGKRSSTDGVSNTESGITHITSQENQIQKPPTEFIGFKTASHKDITISEKAKEKTKDFYKNLDTEIAKTINVQGDINSNTGKKHLNVDDEFNCGIDTQDFLAEELTRIEELFKDNIVENEKPTHPTFQGFQTASRKAIVISEKALKKSMKLFEDIASNESAFNSNSTKENIQVDLRNNIETQKNKNSIQAESTTTLSEFEPALLTSSKAVNSHINTAKAPMLAGFKTASSKPIHISADAMERTNRLLREFEVKDDGLLVDYNESISYLQPSTSKVTGFQTASKKKINISAQALPKSKILLHDFELHGENSGNDNKDKIIIDNLDRHIEDDCVSLKEKGRTNDISKSSTSMFTGFQTASNKAVSISKEALAKSKQIFQDVDIFAKDCDDISEKTAKQNISPGIIGFQTASNKKVRISDKALESSKKLPFGNCDISETAPKCQRLQTASNKKVGISEEVLAKSNMLVDDLNLSQINVSTNTAVDSKDFCRNKSIAENINNDLKDIIVSNHEKHIAFQAASNKSVNISGQALVKTKDIHLENQNNDSPPVFKGFQTASNKQVIISKKALEKSKKLFEDMNLSQCNRDPKTALQRDMIHDAKDPIVSNHENQFGFQTASNKTVKVSAQALAKTKDMFKDVYEDNDIPINDKPPVFTGFQTASNKQVKISKKALEKSKKLFEDMNLSQCNTDPKTALQRDMINDVKDSIVSNHGNKFGFQTASNKTVKVSAQALAKTKDMFNDKALVFKGFQTASNKKVEVSEKALAKSKKLFEDINLSQIEPTTIAQSKTTNGVINNLMKPDYIQNNFEDVQTSRNKKFNVAEQALARTENLFQNMHAETDHNMPINDSETRTPSLKGNRGTSGNKYISPIATKVDNTNNIDRDVIDTQVLNDFNSTLNTEDFAKTTPISKRSGSPILSCPRAKKRKFETPYSTSKKIVPRNVFVPPKLAKTYKFNNDYKKHKKYTLKDIDKLEKVYTKVDIDPYVSEFNFDSLLNFVFRDERNDYAVGQMTVEDLKKTFLNSVNKKIVPEGWLDNHIKLIIWKLLSYEVKFPNVMKNACSASEVLEQLKYRYDRELYHVQRPILRKVLEKDEVPSKTMVLCVAAIYVENVSVTSVPPTSQNVELLVTDGWYCVKACLDRMLVRLVASGAIVIGTKIVVCGAELMNCEQGVSPWEDTSSVRLRLHGNSTGRARWAARLGLRGRAAPRRLRAARPAGGRAAAVRLAVARVYPPVTVERMDDGSTVTLSERLENLRQMKYESERQTIMEKLYEEVEKEMSDLESQDSEGCSNEKGCMDSGSQIAKCMQKSRDPDEYRSHLTKSQSRMLEDHKARQREKLAERVRERFREKLEKYGLKTERNVVQLLKVRVADFEEKGGSVEVTKGFLSIWRPSSAVLELVTEGAWIEILNVIPTGIRNSEIQLSTGRQTVFNPYKPKNDKLKLYANTLQRKCYEIKEISQNPSMTTDYDEIDTVGMIFCIEPSTKEFKEQSFQNVYLADADKNIICVNFWGGLKKFGYENVLDTGQIITCVNLQKRAGNTRKSIPQYRVTEFSYFTKTPKSKKALDITNELTDKLSKIKNKFCEDCTVLKNNYSIFKTKNNENVSPYRFDYNIPKNVVSPFGYDANLNLTGLDFESSFNSQDISPQALLRKKKVNEKIEKIRLNYGEPPPLSSIHIINKSKNASATYKSPLLSNLERSENPLQDVASPVSVNRTFVKNVNPVKLDFSNAMNESVDHFAEDFDASPPLSLDSDVVDN